MGVGDQARARKKTRSGDSQFPRWQQAPWASVSIVIVTAFVKIAMQVIITETGFFQRSNAEICRLTVSVALASRPVTMTCHEPIQLAVANGSLNADPVISRRRSRYVARR
jgi:hypothetical protein